MATAGFKPLNIRSLVDCSTYNTTPAGQLKSSLITKESYFEGACLDLVLRVSSRVVLKKKNVIKLFTMSF